MPTLVTNLDNVDDVRTSYELLGERLRPAPEGLLTELVENVWNRALQSRELLTVMAELYEANERFTLEQLADRSHFSYEEIRNLMYRSLGRSISAARQEVGGRHRSALPELLQKVWNGRAYDYWMSEAVRETLLALK
jgi:hypothetical protein